jgi:hypothetical protein
MGELGKGWLKGAPSFVKCRAPSMRRWFVLQVPRSMPGTACVSVHGSPMALLPGLLLAAAVVRCCVHWQGPEQVGPRCQD